MSSLRSSLYVVILAVSHTTRQSSLPYRAVLITADMKRTQSSTYVVPVSSGVSRINSNMLVKNKNKNETGKSKGKGMICNLFFC